MIYENQYDVAMLLAILTGLTFKHFLADFMLQRSYQFRNKGKYGHPGGLLHSFIHGLGTFLVLIYFLPLDVVAAITAIEMVIHYHIDWAKVQLNSRMKLDPLEDNEYWFLFGFDQFLHHMTYVAILVVLVELGYITSLA
jgi:hypothetical protein